MIIFFLSFNHRLNSKPWSLRRLGPNMGCASPCVFLLFAIDPCTTQSSRGASGGSIDHCARLRLQHHHQCLQAGLASGCVGHASLSVAQRAGKCHLLIVHFAIKRVAIFVSMRGAFRPLSPHGATAAITTGPGLTAPGRRCSAVFYNHNHFNVFARTYLRGLPRGPAVRPLTGVRLARCALLDSPAVTCSQSQAGP
jgi:hypothetical protein